MSVTLLLRTNRITMRRPRSAFTLVELLTVIIIIGLLMALLVPAVMSARIRAIDARVTSEIEQLDSAVKAYKSKYGGFPPTMWSGAPVAQGDRFLAHVRRAFPRARLATSATTFRDDVRFMTDNNTA